MRALDSLSFNSNIMSKEAMHWADQIAERLIHHKKEYVCAAGITPGTANVSPPATIIIINVRLVNLRPISFFMLLLILFPS